MENYEIKNYQSQFSDLIAEWNNIAKFSKENVMIPLPNYFLDVEQGFNVDHALKALSSFLEEKKLMTFLGPVKYYIFKLQYQSDEEKDFYSFRQLYEIYHMDLCKFNKQYHGILAIDISEWVNKNACNSMKFNAFLSFMDDIDDQTLAIFFSDESLHSKNDVAFHIIHKRTRLQRVESKKVDDAIAFSYLLDLLDSYHLVLDAIAKKALKETVHEVLQIADIEGMSSIGVLGEDIVYSIYKKDQFNGKVTLLDIQEFTLQGSWLDRMRSKKNIPIGFLGE